MTPPEPVLPTVTLNGLIIVWQLIGAPILAAVFYYVRDSSRQLRAINGRLKVVETWMEEHEKADDGRFEGTRRELDQIQRRCERALKSHTPSHGGMGDQ
jgi:hypothetical protein